MKVTSHGKSPLLPSLNQTSDDSPPLFSRPFRFYFTRNWKLFGLGLLTLFFTNAFDAITPYLVGKAIDQISQKKSWEDLGHTILLLLGTSSFLAFFRYLWRIVWGRFHHGVAEDLRNRIFDKFLDLGPSFYQKRSIGELMSLITNDVNSFRMGIGPGTLVIMDALFILVIVPPLMISLSWSWTWKTLILMPIVPPIVAYILRLIFENYKKQQNEFASMSGAAQEIVSGIRVIKSYVQEINQTRLFNHFNRKYEMACNQVAKVDAYFPPIMEFSVAIGSVILLAIGSQEVMSGSISIGSFFSFYQYIQRMIWPMTALGIGFNHIQQGKASFSRIVDLLQKKNDVPDEGQKHIKEFRQLEVKNLNFTYAESVSPVIKNVSFKIHAGETIGIIGETGSGKSTLVDLICRLYPVSLQSIFYNDIPIENITKTSLRKTVSLVPQEAFLFSKPIQDNVALSQQEWSIEEVHSLSQLVNMDEEINQIPGNYNAYLGERGVNLSGGQKQRLTIARALMANAPLVIFDDSLSAIDAKTEKSILSNLRARHDQSQSQHSSQPSHQRLTVIIVSHRIASLKWADRIIVLKKGEVEAIGSHEELLLISPTYQQLVMLQREGQNQRDLIHE